MVTTDLPSKLELKLRWSESSCWNRTRLWPRFHSLPLGIVGPVANVGGVPKFLRWGHGEPLSEFSLAFSALGLETSLQRDAVHKSRGRWNNVPSASASLTLVCEVVKPVSVVSLACPAKPVHRPSSRRCPRPTSRFRRGFRAGRWPLRKSGKRLGPPFHLGDGGGVL